MRRELARGTQVGAVECFRGCTACHFPCLLVNNLIVPWFTLPQIGYIIPNWPHVVTVGRAINALPVIKHFQWYRYIWYRHWKTRQ